MSDEFNYTIYKTKQIQFLGEGRYILLANDNAQCCLLAICNALALRNNLVFNSTDKNVWELEELVLGCFEELSPNHVFIGDAILALRNLDDYDPRPTWDRVDGFKKEEDDCSSIFDVLGIPFFHGWVVDSVNAQARSYDDIKHGSSDIENNMRQRNTLITDVGLQRLEESIQDHAICILYKNHEFFTATKHEGQLYMLETADDDMSGKQIRWAKDSGDYFGENFSPKSVSGSDSVGVEDLEVDNTEAPEGGFVGGALDDAAGGLEYHIGEPQAGVLLDDAGGQHVGAGSGSDDSLGFMNVSPVISPTNVLDGAGSTSSGSSD